MSTTTNPTPRLLSLLLWLMEQVSHRDGSCRVGALGFVHSQGLLFTAAVDGPETPLSTVNSLMPAVLPAGVLNKNSLAPAPPSPSLSGWPRWM